MRRTVGYISAPAIRARDPVRQTKVTYIAANWGEQQFLASWISAVRLGRFLGPPSHNRTFVRDMLFHSDVGILSNGDRHGRIA